MTVSHDFFLYFPHELRLPRLRIVYSAARSGNKFWISCTNEAKIVYVCQGLYCWHRNFYFSWNKSKKKYSTVATRLICDSFISNQNVQCFVLQTLSERSVIFYIWLNVEQIGAHKQVVQLDSAQCFTARSPTPRKVSQLQSISPRIKSELGWSRCAGQCLAFGHMYTVQYLAHKPDI